MLISTLVIDRRDEWVPFLPKTTQTFPEEITKRTACRLCTPSWSWSSRPPLQVAKNNHKVRSEVCKVQTSFTIDLKFPQKGKTFLCNVSDLLKSGYSEHKNHLHPCTAEMKPIDASMVVTKQSPADSQVWNTAYNVMFFLEFLIVVCYSLEDVKKMTVEPIDKPSGGSRGPWGAVPLAPKIFLKSCSFQAILREKPLFWANCGLGPPLGSKLRWPPWPKSCIRAWHLTTSQLQWWLENWTSDLVLHWKWAKHHNHLRPNSWFYAWSQPLTVFSGRHCHGTCRESWRFSDYSENQGGQDFTT